MFTTLEESVSYCVCMRHFPPETYDCIVGLMRLMGSISEAVVSQHIVENQMLMGVWTGLSLRQSTIVALFSASYPAILVNPKAGRDYIQHGSFVDFVAMKTFEEWDKGDARHGLAVTLTKSM